MAKVHRGCGWDLGGSPTSRDGGGVVDSVDDLPGGLELSSAIVDALHFVFEAVGEDGPIATCPVEFVFVVGGDLGFEAMFLLGDGEWDDGGCAEAIGPFAIESMVDGEEHGDEFIEKDLGGVSRDHVGAGPAESGEADRELVVIEEIDEGLGVWVMEAADAEDIPARVVSDGGVEDIA